MNNCFPEPTWCVPQEALDPCSSFYYAGPSPFLLSGVFLRLLQYHFSSPDNIEETLLKGYIWTPSDKGCIGTGTPPEESSSSSEETNPLGECSEPATATYQYTAGSKLAIKPSYSTDTASIQQVPALYVKREPFQVDTISMLDRALPGLNQHGVYEGTDHNVTVSGSHSIICRGSKGAEADLLGQEVYFRMLHYQQVIKRDFQLGKLMARSVSEVRQRTDEAQSTFYTVVRMEWAYVYRWRVIPESPIMKRVAFQYQEV